MAEDARVGERPHASIANRPWAAKVYDLNRDRLYGHIKTRKGRTEFLVFCRYLPALYPPEVRIGIVLDNFSPHLSTKADPRVGEWAAANTSSWPTYRSTPPG